jgi:hypothetical protein
MLSASMLLGLMAASPSLELGVALHNNQSRHLAPSCLLVKHLDTPTSAVKALVRSQHYAKGQKSGCHYEGAPCSSSSLDPLCGSAASSCYEAPERACGGDEHASFQVPLNSRSYSLAKIPEKFLCSGRLFGGVLTRQKGSATMMKSYYDCMDYGKGAYHMASKTFTFDVDVSGAGCGCNAAIYLVNMPQNEDPTECLDFYCDSNALCGAHCAEIDLMEANKVAFTTTVHVADDPDGESFGIGHYVGATQKRLTSERGDACAYGPHDRCTIDTNKMFRARYDFAGHRFSYTLTLEQTDADGTIRRAFIPSPIKYLRKPSKGSVTSADAANEQLRQKLHSGLTLTFSYWSGKKAKDMDWLDGTCSASEKKDWQCTNAWSEHHEWPWTCDKATALPLSLPSCSRSFMVSAAALLCGVGPDKMLFACAADSDGTKLLWVVPFSIVLALALVGGAYWFARWRLTRHFTQAPGDDIEMEVPREGGVGVDDDDGDPQQQ